jgi:lambda family phage tail tape measure protein
MVAETVTKRIIELDIKASADAMRVLKQQTERMKQLENAAKSTKDMLKNFAGGFIAAFSFGAAVDSIKSVIDAMDQANDVSQQLGLSVEEIQEWNHAAEMSGASAEDFSAGVRGLTKSMAELGAGTTESSKALKKMGVDTKDTTDQALTKIAEAFSKLQDGPQKTALAMDIFGKSGAKLIPMLNEGAAGIEKLKQEARDLGIVFDQEAAARAAEFNDSLDLTKKAAKGIATSLAIELMPALQSIGSAMVDTVKNGNNVKDMGRGLSEIMVYLSQAVSFVIGSLTALGKLLGGLAAAGVALATKDFKTAADIMSDSWTDAKSAMVDTFETMEKLRTEFEAKKAGAPPLMGPPEPPKRRPSDEFGTDKGKSKLDEQKKALNSFIQSTTRASIATEELTYHKQYKMMVDEKERDLTKVSVEQLKKEAEAIAAVADKAKESEKWRKDQTDAYKEATKAADDYKKTQTDLKEEFLRMNDPLRAITQQYEQLQIVIAETTNPEERAQLERVMKELNMQASKISEAWAKTHNVVVDKTIGSFADMGTLLEDRIKSFANTATDALLGFTEGSKASFSDMIESMLKDMAKLALKQSLNPFFEMIGSTAKTAVSSGGAGIAEWFRGMFAAQKGAVFAPAGLVPFATGGVVSSPTVFPMASGGVGVMGEAGAEAVVPLRRDASGNLGVSSTPVYVTVINNSSSRIKTEETKDPQGKTSLQIMVEEAVEKSMGRGRYDKVLATSYGVMRRGQ